VLGRRGKQPAAPPPAAPLPNERLASIAEDQAHLKAQFEADVETDAADAATKAASAAASTASNAPPVDPTAPVPDARV
jgi:hypothetical protein